MIRKIPDVTDIKKRSRGHENCKQQDSEKSKHEKQNEISMRQQRARQPPDYYGQS